METPNLKIYEHDGEHTERTLTMIRVREIRCRKAWRPAYGAILLAAPGLPDGSFFAGQPVEISGVLALPKLRWPAGFLITAPISAARGLLSRLTSLARNGEVVGVTQ